MGFQVGFLVGLPVGLLVGFCVGLRVLQTSSYTQPPLPKISSQQSWRVSYTFNMPGISFDIVSTALVHMVKSSFGRQLRSAQLVGDDAVGDVEGEAVGVHMS